MQFSACEDSCKYQLILYIYTLQFNVIGIIKKALYRLHQYPKPESSLKWTKEH